MLSWSLAFFIVAIIAAVFGFGGIASGAAEIARICFFFFIVAFFASLICTWSPDAAPARPFSRRDRIQTV